MSKIRVVPLGAGQDVGRSCILVSIGGKNIMFDCGMHMGFQVTAALAALPERAARLQDARRFPDFSFISKSGSYTQFISAVAHVVLPSPCVTCCHCRWSFHIFTSTTVARWCTSPNSAGMTARSTCRIPPRRLRPSCWPTIGRSRSNATARRTSSPTK